MVSTWWYSPFQPMKYMTFSPSQSLVIMMLFQLWLSLGVMFNLVLSRLMPSSWLLNMLSHVWNSRITQIVARTKTFFPSVLQIVKIKPKPYMLKKKIPKLHSQTFYIGKMENEMDFNCNWMIKMNQGHFSYPKAIEINWNHFEVNLGLGSWSKSISIALKCV